MRRGRDATIRCVLVASLMGVVSCSSGGGEGQSAPTPTLAEVDCEGGECADLGFVATDTFGFENWGGNKYDNDEFGVGEMVALYGVEQVCSEYTDDSCVMNPGATQRMTELDAMLRSGRCEGMAVMANRFKLGLNSTGDFRPEAEVAAALRPADPFLVDLISYWWATQFNEETLNTTAKFRALTPSQLAKEIAAGLEANAGYTMGIYFEGSGHALLPVAVRLVDEGTFEIDVYDSNTPATINKVLIDVDSETWSYEFGAVNGDQDAKVWSGTTGSMDITPMSAREGQSVCESCADASGTARSSAPIRVNALPKGASTMSLTIETESGDVVVTPTDVTSTLEGAVVQQSRDGLNQGVTILLPPSTSGIRFTTSTSGGDGDDAGGLLSVTRPGSSPVQLELSPTTATGDAADTSMTLDDAGDGLSVVAGNGVDVETTLATGNQSIVVSVTDNQELEMLRTAGGTASNEGIRVVVSDEGRTVLATDVEVNDSASTTTISTVTGVPEVSTTPIEATAILDASGISGLATKGEATQVDSPLTTAGSSPTTTTRPPSAGAADVATAVSAFDATIDGDILALSWGPLPSDYTSGIIIEVASGSGPFREVGRRARERTSYRIAGLPLGDLRVRLRILTSGADVYSSVKSLTVTNVPTLTVVPGPVSLRASMSDQLSLAWTASSPAGLIEFGVFVESENGTFELYRGGFDEREYSRPAIPGVERVYVEARYSTGAVSRSNTVTVGAPLPKASTISVSTSVTLVDSQVTVTWSTSSTVALQKWVVWVRDTDTGVATPISTRGGNDRSYSFPRPAGKLVVFVVGDFGTIGSVTSATSRVPDGPAGVVPSTSTTTSSSTTTTTVVPVSITLSAVVLGDGTVRLNWSTPPVPAVKWEVRVDGATVATIDGSLSTHDVNPAAGTRSILVRGDFTSRSVDSNAVSVNVPVSSTTSTSSTTTTTTLPAGPTISASGVDFGSGSVKIEWTTSGSDPGKWEIIVDGVLVDTIVNGALRSTLRNVGKGSRQITVRADYGTNPNPSASFTIVLN